MVYGDGFEKEEEEEEMIWLRELELREDTGRRWQARGDVLLAGVCIL